MEFNSFEEIVARLQDLRDQGYIVTHREGNTGIGKTLEDELGIRENNEEDADITLSPTRNIELKSIRDGTDSRMTLFTKEPPKRDRRIWGTDAIAQFGYYDAEQDRQSLYTTLEFDDPNPQGLYLTYRNSRLAVAHTDYGVCAYYPRSTIRLKVEEKFPELIVVTAKTKGEGAQEVFWYSEALHLTGFDCDSFFSLLEQGDITLDTRMHLSGARGSAYRNHGTAWRVKKQDLSRIFGESTELLAGEDAGVGSEIDVRAQGQQFLRDYV